MESYFIIVNKVLSIGKMKENRTGVNTIAVPGAYFEHDMSTGFPLLTTKQVSFRLVASELEFFIKGITDKKWLIDRNNHIWDEWCRPDIVPYGHDKEIQRRMKEENDLGPIYGWQWRHFGANYKSIDEITEYRGVDQLQMIIDKLKTDPSDRRMIVNAWNPVDLKLMALPPCHYSFQIVVIDDKINLLWNQRSVDVALGLPFNIASYGLLLHLLSLESGFEEGNLIGFLGDVHIYDSHLKGIKEQINRNPLKLPTIKTSEFTSIFEWNHTNSKIENYQHHPKINFEIAV